MEVNVTGGNAAQRKQVKALASWLMFKLLREKKAQTIDLDIKLERNLVEKEQNFGSVEMWENDRNPTDFFVRLDCTVPLEVMLVTLCHEAVHVRQYATGQLLDYSTKPRIRFRNKQYGVDLHYDRQPWEIEAHRLQQPLYDEYQASPKHKS